MRLIWASYVTTLVLKVHLAFLGVLHIIVP